jgi:hypothetical protein
MVASRSGWLSGRRYGHKHGAGLIHRLHFEMGLFTILQRCFPIGAPIAHANSGGTKTPIPGWAMTEKEDRLAREREEIAARIANFKATQKKFERERQEYYAMTLAGAWDKFTPPSQ